MPNAATAGSSVLHVLIGTSEIKGIEEDKLISTAATTKIIKYTIYETIDFIQTCELCQDFEILYSLTNDLTRMEPEAVSMQKKEMIITVKGKLVNTSTVIHVYLPFPNG